MSYRGYIPVKKYWFDMYTRNFKEKYWKPEPKVPISHIQIDKSLFSYQNEVSESAVLQMLVNFDKDLWMPVIVNKDYYLLDGQLRLAVAKQLGLKYIDVVVQDTELLQGK